MPITPGMQGQATLTVDQSHTARALGSGNVPTLGTPALIALMERAAVHAVRRGLDDGEETVGTMVNVRHLAPTALGKHIRAEATVTAVNGRAISFNVVALDSHGKIGEGTHERLIVDRDEFVWKAATRGA
jgi:fluoroacetyl-CoA thioesterase